MMLQSELQTESANAMADNSNPDLAVAEGLPGLCCVDVGFRLVKTGNNLGALSQTEYG